MLHRKVLLHLCTHPLSRSHCHQYPTVTHVVYLTSNATVKCMFSQLTKPAGQPEDSQCFGRRYMALCSKLSFLSDRLQRHAGPTAVFEISNKCCNGSHERRCEESKN